jgi:Flp pilus assembly protein CpaB
MASGTRRPSRTRPLLAVHDQLMDAATSARLWLHGFRSTPLGRRVARRRLVALVVAGFVAVTVGRLVGTAHRSVAQWGPTAPVVVAAAPLPAGALLGPGSVRTVQWPARLVPDGALTTTDGRRTSRTVAAGAPLTANDLADADRGAVAARLPDGAVGVTVPRGAAPAPVRTGDRVDVVGTTASGRELGAERVAARATVVSVDRVAVTVAVRRVEADGVAAAAAAGTAVLVLVP